MTKDDPRIDAVARELLARDCAEHGLAWTWDAINDILKLKLRSDAKILLAASDDVDPRRSMDWVEVTTFSDDERIFHNMYTNKRRKG